MERCSECGKAEICVDALDFGLSLCQSCYEVEYELYQYHVLRQTYATYGIEVRREVESGLYNVIDSLYNESVRNRLGEGIDCLKFPLNFTRLSLTMRELVDYLQAVGELIVSERGRIMFAWDVYHRLTSDRDKNPYLGRVYATTRIQAIVEARLKFGTPLVDVARVDIDEKGEGRNGELGTIESVS